MACKNSTYGPNFAKGIDKESKCSAGACGEGAKECSSFQLSKAKDGCFIDGVIGEALHIGGADLNVYKLMGVHEQTSLVDSTGRGVAISNGDFGSYQAVNAFSEFQTSWISIQKGEGVVPSAYIGYDFGVIKTSDGTRDRYGVIANIYHHVSSLRIKQSSNPNKRTSTIRVERSNDGKTWYGVQVIPLPDDDCLNTIHFNQSIPSRFWRIRPVVWESPERWEIQALELTNNHIATNDTNIQDLVLLENRDRDYSTTPIGIKGSYDLFDVTSDLTRYGIELPTETLYANVNFKSVVLLLGRPVVVGDIIEIPSEQQYDVNLNPIKKFMEVTDIGWSTEGFTPGWTPTMVRLILQPAFASQETQDIFGDLATEPLPEGLGLSTNLSNANMQDYMDVNLQVQVEADMNVPLDGRETSSTIRQFTEDELEAMDNNGVASITNQNPTGLYTEDAMPPNNKPYTEGTEYPSSAENGDYHRMSYEGLSQDIPVRLYRYSSAKNRWIYLETDRRSINNGTKPRIREFIESGKVTPSQYLLRENPHNV